MQLSTASACTYAQPHSSQTPYIGPTGIVYDSHVPLLRGCACRFLFKKAHLSRDDFRVFDYASGHPVAVMHHFGKNPYAALDPLELSGTSNAYDQVRARKRHPAAALVCLSGQTQLHSNNCSSTSA